MKDIVTELRAERDGYRVMVNDSEVFHLSKADYIAAPLAQGDELDLDAYKHQLLLRQYPAALNRAVAFLAARAHSRQEVSRKLNDRGYLPDVVELVMYKLEKEALLNDEDFARAWVRVRSTRQLGKPRLLQELRVKGVPEEIAQAAVAELPKEETDTQALALAEKLLRRHASEEATDAMRKSVAAMLRRGYSYGEASRALRRALNQEHDGEE